MTAAEFHAAIDALGITQRVLAARFKVAHSTVSAWATGKAPVPGTVVAYLESVAENRRLMAALQAAVAVTF